MNENIIDRKDSIEMIPEKKPIHLRIVSIGAFILLTLVLLVVMDMLIVALAENLAISHAGIGGLVTDDPVSTYVLAIRASAIVCLAISIWFGLLGERMYLHRPGRILQKLLTIMVCALAFVMLGIGVGLLLTFGIFFWNPKQFVDWKIRNLKIYRFGFVGIILAIMLSEMVFGQPFLTLTLSSILTPAGAWAVSLFPGFLVIPLYLFLPKVIRDIWNMRPSVENFWKEFVYHPMGMLGLAIIGSIVFVAVFAPYIAPYYWENPPGAPINLDELLQPPSAEHILGTNHRGQDIFSRIIYGSQISLMIGFVASVVAVFLGTTVGLIAGYYGGILDVILMRITDVFLCLPTLPLMLIFLMLFGQGLQNVIIVIAILGWTGTARMVRSEALSLREQPLTEAAHALGASDGYILIHHILPNTLPLILANMILGVVTAILSEAGIAFLGFVDIHGQPSWGIVLHWAWKNAALLANKWWWFIPPGVLIMLTTLGFVFISHTADKVVNPRLRGRRS